MSEKTIVIENQPNSSQPGVGDDAALEMPAAAARGETQAVAASMPPDDAAPAEVLAESRTPAGEHRQTDAAELAAEDDEPVAREEEVEERGPIEETPVLDEPPKMDWFILKVQSNREESIRESLKRRVAVAGLDRYFGDIIVPTEMVSEFKGGKKRVVKRKLYPGYLVVNMEINEETWFLVRETPGIGDFTGSAGKPTPMLTHEVNKIVAKQEEKTLEAPKLKINFNVGDRVKINEGTFENFEGDVDTIDEASGRVTVMINIFGRSTPVELEYWQIETI
ncbi:MAG TPA: transcription termination/antitermination protein NusG [Pirellulales bacterium]|nr:transcription termination/antitermination protein NusG [Pirellulales bacterium]